MFFCFRSYSKIKFVVIKLSLLWVFFFFCMVTIFFLFVFFLRELGFLLITLNFFLCFLKYFFREFRYRNIFIFDYLRVFIVVLTILVFLVILTSGSFDFYKSNNWSKFLILIVIFLFFLVSVFLTRNYFVFYLFFEFAVVPIFIFMVGWGYRVSRIQSSIYIFLYTFFFSLPLLAILLNFGGVSFFFLYSFHCSLMKTFDGFMWLFYLVIFMVKLPVFFLHLWLPKAHVDAPLLGSMVLAGVLLKLGGYGIYKSLFYFSTGSFSIIIFLSIFSFFGGIVIGSLCLRQVDLKNLIAYSSVVHIGPVLGSLFLINFIGLLGGCWMIFSHGLCSSCLFFLLNLFYLNSRRRSFLLRRGVLWVSPTFSFIWFFFCILNIGFPPSFNFFSELFIIIGVFSMRFFFCFLIFILLLLRGFYNIIMFSNRRFGVSKNFLYEFFTSSKDLLTVLVLLVPLLFFVFFTGFCYCQFKANLWY